MALMTSRNNSTIITAGEDLPQHSFVYCKSSDSKYYLADASNEATADCVGIVSHTNGIEQGALGTIQISPCIANNESWNLTKGVTIYLGDSGSLTQTQPTSGIIKPLGFAVTEHQISFNPNLGWYAEETVTPETIDSYFDTDITLAGNDDNKVATQRATKSYVDARIQEILDLIS